MTVYIVSSGSFLETIPEDEARNSVTRISKMILISRQAFFTFDKNMFCSEIDTMLKMLKHVNIWSGWVKFIRRVQNLVELFLFTFFRSVLLFVFNTRKLRSFRGFSFLAFVYV